MVKYNCPSLFLTPCLDFILFSWMSTGVSSSPQLLHYHQKKMKQTATITCHSCHFSMLVSSSVIHSSGLQLRLRCEKQSCLKLKKICVFIGNKIQVPSLEHMCYSILNLKENAYNFIMFLLQVQVQMILFTPVEDWRKKYGRKMYS